MSDSRFATCLWFDAQGETAARFYCELFADAEVLKVTRTAPDGPALMVEFRLGAQRYQALNGGAHYVLSPAASISVLCDDQAEIDRLWAALGEGAHFSNCGWLTDRFGLSWQIVPRALPEMMNDPDPAKVARVVQAFMPMDKLDLATLIRAYQGE